ncbi:MAG TPA: glycosyltransferase family 39 protein [Mycobacteriales bacterium]
MVYRVVGVSDVAARALSAFFSILTVVLLYVLGRVLYDRWVAAIAALVLAVSGYSVGLGRMALLDSTATCFVVLAVLFLALWLRSPDVRWACGFAAATMLGAQAKVTSILVVPVLVITLLLTGSWRRLSVKTVVLGSVSGLVALAPGIVQMAAQPSVLAAFLDQSLQRRSAVPWTYYPQVLLRAEGVALVLVLGVGILVAAGWPRRADILPWSWVAVFGLFFALYPLKAFNYLLPVAPALALLAGRGLAQVRLARVPAVAIAGSLAVGLCLVSAPAVASVVRDDSNVGAREAARWLANHAPAGAGVMAMSHGSAQYVYSFYAGLDAYPFGRFRLSTVLPGGAIATPHPAPPGRLPLDWVTLRPGPLIDNGTVSYLVYTTGELDDPPEQSQIIETMTQRQFRALIETYGGQLVHTVRWNHEARAYVYRVTKRAAPPRVTFTVTDQSLEVRGVGFERGAPVTVTYNRKRLATTIADSSGAVTASVPRPENTQHAYFLVLTDSAGNSASAIGLPAPSVRLTSIAGMESAVGRGFTPGAKVKVTYHGMLVAVATAAADGTVQVSLQNPPSVQPRYRLRMTDTDGHTAWVAGYPAPTIAFSALGGSVNVTGQHFEPLSTVTLTYHKRVVARAATDATGAFSARFVLPTASRQGYVLRATDSDGRVATVSGLVSSKATPSTDGP